ncbi:MAG: FAD:protein FMN transferase, partial [Chitinivibrionales bacterium]|nr:FAD:protein FMN transferase [Chitinivibrionales bacterium]MBD3356213.1 FAD:protein FMN transferase [Chitinivibrionales bacterium]
QLIHGLNAQSVAAEIAAEIARLHHLWSVFEPAGTIARLAAHAGSDPIAVDTETIEILRLVTEFGELTDGAFDVTIAPLSTLWRTAIDTEEPANPQDIAAKLSLVGFHDIEILPPTHARLRRPGQAIDLGGIAKGWVADRAVHLCERHGIRSALINLGGNVVAVGSRPGGSPWKVGIRDPRGDSTDLVGFLLIENGAVVTAGDYERYFVRGNRRYHHMIDPRTGMPAQSGLAGVTVRSDRSVVADVLATAAFILGVDRAFELIDRVPGTQALFMGIDGRMEMTEGFELCFAPV